MEEVTLTEAETRYYSDLFACCDLEKSGKIPWPKAKELFHTANISNESVVEITSLAGIPSAALHISRAQFYSCLKLIAAHQAELPLRQELIAATVPLALPRFSWRDAGSGVSAELATGLNALHPPPVTDRRNSLQRRRSSQQDAPHSDVPSTDSEVEQNESSCGGGGGGSSSGKCIGAAGGGSGVASSSSSRETHRRRADGGSPEAWSTNSDSPTPTNSVTERPWAQDSAWQGLFGDEHRQLLGTEEESSDRHSSEEDNESELLPLYRMNAEQLDYYITQFKTVQRDPNGLLSGQAARNFFEKSRIPVDELRHIWQLCDVTKDGALSLAEFASAMHLVVLRRNNIPLPNALPSFLHPNVLQLASHHITNEPPEADLLHLNDDEDDDNTDNTIVSGNLQGSGSSSGVTIPVRTGPSGCGIELKKSKPTSRGTIPTSSQLDGSIHTRLTSTPPRPLPQPNNRSISNSPTTDSKSSASPQNLIAMAQATMASTSSGITAASSSRIRENPYQQLWASDASLTGQWTKFSESPTTTTSTASSSKQQKVSSPGLKPVNFDIKRTAQEVVSNPQILHPVPLRVTPVASAAAASGICEVQIHQAPHDESSSSLEGNLAKCSIKHRDSTQNNDLRAIQRPQAKKLPGKNIGALPPPPQREPSIGAGDAAIVGGSELSGNQSFMLKKEPPPLPPPRPHRHARSSSLDLNKFKVSGSNSQQPEITAQTSFDLQTSTGFADFTQFPEDSSTAAANVGEPSVEEQQQHSLPPIPATPVSVAMPPTLISLQSNQRVSAFEVYRKPNTPRNSQSPPPPPLPKQSSQQQQQQQKPQHYAQQPTQPPPPAPFGSVGAAALSTQPLPPPPLATAATSAGNTISSLPNADIFEKRVTAISETLRHVSFKQNEHSMPDVLRHLREQNNLLLRLCNDLSDELLTVQTRKEEMRLKLESVASNVVGSVVSSSEGGSAANQTLQTRTVSSISAPVTANVTGGSSGSAGHTNV